MFVNTELDICPAFGWQGGPSFNTRVVTTQAWMERRNANSAQCRHSYSLPLQNITDVAYLLRLKQTFVACRGQLHSFLVKDYTDHAAQDELFAQGDGTALTFQLSKTSYFGAASYTRIITKPQASVAVTVDGAAASVVVDTAVGTVTFAAAPAAGALLRWTGEFRVPVRFANDALNTTIDNKNRNGAFFINGSVDLIEVFGE